MILLLLVVLVFVLAIGWPWSGMVLAVAALAETAEVILLRRWARRLERRHHAVDPDAALVGAVAEVVSPCRPTGQVRLRGELWEARCTAGADSGDRVRVQAVDGLNLVVAPAPADDGAPAPSAAAR